MHIIEQAVKILQQGGLVAFPTETVYGLGADANNSSAVAKIFAAKGRPADHPLIVHIADIAEISQWASHAPSNLELLAKHFWPGPLTVILPKKSHVLNEVTGGQNTIGLRIPNHPIALELLKKFGHGLAAPSANRFTRLSPTSYAAVCEELGNKVDLILDGGECNVGLESTILDLSRDQARILRPGMISSAAIESVLKQPILEGLMDTAVRTPGMHQLHYSPATPIELADADKIPLRLKQEAAIGNRCAVLSLDLNELQSELPNFHAIIPMKVEPEHYAHDLYDVLRKLDHENFHLILLQTVPNTPGWLAIRDRLKRAAGK